MLAIRRGKVVGVCAPGDDLVDGQAVLDWALDPEVHHLLVPDDIARRSHGASEAQVREWLRDCRLPIADCQAEPVP